MEGILKARGIMARRNYCTFLRGDALMGLKLKISVGAAIVLTICAGSVFAQGPADAAPKATADCAELPKLAAKVEAQSRTLQDWPNLARYREANASLSAPGKDEQRVVFMGDSITDMWALPRFGGFFPGKPYVVRGIRSQSFLHGGVVAGQRGSRRARVRPAGEQLWARRGRKSDCLAR